MTVKPATDEEIAEKRTWDEFLPCECNGPETCLSIFGARLFARIEADRAEIAALRAQLTSIGIAPYLDRMAELARRADEKDAEIARLKAEVERLTSKAMTCADCGGMTEDLHPASSHPDAATVCRSCGPNRLDMERQRAWSLKLEDALVRVSLAIACLQTGLGAAEDVTTASKDIAELGLRIMAVQADMCPSCAGDLDTGWECNECKADWFWIGAYCSTHKERQTLIDGTGRAR